MRALLFVMNPRRIPECMSAIEALDIDRCWLTGMTEWQLVPFFAEVVESTDYDAYLALSDDGVPTQEALDAVLACLDDGHPVATGYCNLDERDNSHVVNLTRSQLKTFPPGPATYDNFTRAGVLESKDDPVRTWFAGYALTGMGREMWQRYPFQVLGDPPGCCSDFMLSWRLQHDNVPIVAPKAGFYRHVKERWNMADRAAGKRLLIGEIKPEVRIEVAV